MKHLLFLSALFTIVAFSSCGNSDDDNGSELAPEDYDYSSEDE